MKINNKQLKEILEELYALDVNLRSKEKELIAIIDRITAQRPEVKFDQAFRRRLRAEIMRLATPPAENKILTNLIFNFNLMMKKIIFSAAGAALAVMLLVSAFSYIYEPGAPINRPLALNFKVSSLGDKAFGALTTVPESGAAGESLDQGVAEPANQSASIGSAGGIVKGSPASRAIGMGGGGGVAESGQAMIMPPYEYKNYSFVYKGGQINVPDKLDVLKRIKGVKVSVNMPTLLNGLNFGLADIGSFAGLNVQNINLIQSQDKGYIVSVFPDEGSISIYQNWETWPAGKCFGDGNCFERQRVSLSGIPSNEELVKIADAFLTEHNIDKSLYGEPEVSKNNNWKIMYETYPDKANFYFPENIEVIYPLKLNDKFVYDEYNGVKQGLSVSINVKEKKVASIYNLTSQNYQSSAYEMETDAQKLITYAEQGGVNNYLYGNTTKSEELELGDPEIGYIRYYNYKQGENVELLIPALYFPINNPPQDSNFFRQAIVIPLAKEILAERQINNIVGPEPRPMPLGEPAIEPMILKEGSASIEPAG